MSDLIKQQAVIDKLDEIQKDIIASPYRNVIECYINYCPMCGRELQKKVE